jgi:chromosome segregation ATPase
LDETRLTLSKWIETQQIISKERNDWQQGKEILQGRIELVGKEVGILKDRIKQSEAAVEESNKKRDELIAENDALKVSGAQLGEGLVERGAVPAGLGLHETIEICHPVGVSGRGVAL